MKQPNLQFHEKTISKRFAEVTEFCAVCNEQVKYRTRLVSGTSQIGVYKIGFITRYRIDAMRGRCLTNHLMGNND